MNEKKEEQRRTLKLLETRGKNWRLTRSDISILDVRRNSIDLSFYEVSHEILWEILECLEYPSLRQLSRNHRTQIVFRPSLSMSCLPDKRDLRDEGKVLTIYDDDFESFGCRVFRFYCFHRQNTQ